MFLSKESQTEYSLIFHLIVDSSHAYVEVVNFLNLANN